MIESERGSTPLTIPPPPPWAQPPPDPPAAPDAQAREREPQQEQSPPGAEAPAPAVGAPAPAADPLPPQTVTVSSAASPLSNEVTTIAPPPAVTAGQSRRPVAIVAIALVVVLLVGLGLVLFQRNSAGTSAAPVSGPITQLGGDPQPEPGPTTLPTTAPPTTQALPPATVITRVTTTDPVVFITIDDGWHVPPEARAMLMGGTLPVTTFILSQVLDKDPPLWKELDTKSGSVENHSISHPNLSKMNLAQQQEQICTASEDIAAKLGRFPTMFRPPYGATNAETVVAAGNCGIKYLVKWGASVNNAKVTFASGSALRPGDIVLMHYRPELAGDLQAVMKAAEAAGLKPALLSDYLK